MSLRLATPSFLRWLRPITHRHGTSINFATVAAAAGTAAAAVSVTADCQAEVRAPIRAKTTESVKRAFFVRCEGGEKEMHERYEFADVVGSGGFGTVQKAKHKQTGLVRAIKRVECVRQAESPSSPEMLAEVEALMDLTHPNVVRLFEYYQSESALYLVEEYCSGGTLEQRLKEHGGRLDASEAALMLRQMLRGLLYCHAHGLAHRDLKPDNFVFQSRDASTAIKVRPEAAALREARQRASAPGRAVAAGAPAQHMCAVRS